MTTKVVKELKYVGLFSMVFFALISCEKEIESIGVNLVNNVNFSTGQLSTEVLTSNKNIESVPANGLAQYLLGVYSDVEFGKLEASIVSQLSPPLVGAEYNYGKNAVIDSVIVTIPYQVTRDKENYEGGKPKFSIDSIIGDTDAEFKISVYELKTFLNTLDPIDPSKPAIYPSNKEFLKGDIPLFSGNFKVNPKDTVSYIKRYLSNASSVYTIDTVKIESSIPSIKLPLNESLIKQLFVDKAAGPEFESVENFQHYFRGLYIESSALSNNESHLISLAMVNANMTIYYSNDQDETAEEDLNGNGVKGENGVRVKKKHIFQFGGIKSNVLKRDTSISHQSGNDRMYVQGAAGSMATLDLLSNENLVALQNENWLITGANLIFYVDQNASSSIAPNQLFLYNYEENLQITDVITEGILAVGGLLERDEEGKPYRYVFKITDYISELLKSEEPVNLVKLGLKVYNPTDLPTSILDTKVKEYNWNPRGVVLFGHGLSAGDKRVKLEIFHSQINN